MTNSYVRYAGNGAVTNFSVTFPYINKDHIVATVDGSPVSFTWVNATTVTIHPEPAAGTVVELRRVTPSAAPIVDFQDGALLTEDQLNINSAQGLYVAEESRDIASDSLQRDIHGRWDGKNLRLANIAMPSLDTDAANRSFVQAAIDGAAQLGLTLPAYNPLMPGSESRALSSKLGDHLSVRDFGATGNGTTDDTVALQAALDTGAKTIVCPPGEYRVGEAGIKPKSGQTIVLHGATLRKYVAVPSGAVDKTQSLFDFQDLTDVTVVGGTIRRGNDKQWGVRLISGNAGIRFIGTTFKDIAPYIHTSNNNRISFLGCVIDLGLGTANTGICVGSPINPITGETTGGAGYCDGLQIEGCVIIGGGNEAIDINWPTRYASITGNLFINNHTVGSDDEVVDVGGSTAQSATVAAGGSGYAVGDIVEVPGGVVTSSAGTPRRARFRVDAVTGGQPTALSIPANAYTDGSFPGGHYQTFPGNTGLSTTTITGSGTGLTLNVAWGFCSDIVIANNVFIMNPSAEGPVIRLKWESRRLNVSNNIAYYPFTPSGDALALKVEQCHDVVASGNDWENIARGFFAEGPCSNVKYLRNTSRGLIGAGVITRTTSAVKDVIGLVVDGNTLIAQDGAAGQIVDLSSTQGAVVTNNSIVMGAGNTTCTGISIRAGNDDLTVAFNRTAGGYRGILGASGATSLTIHKNSTFGTWAEGIRLEGQNDYSEITGSRIKDAGNNGTAYSIAVIDIDWSRIADNLMWDAERGLNIGTGGEWNIVKNNMASVTTTPYMNLPLLKNSDVQGNMPRSGSGYQSITLADDTAIAIPLTQAALVSFVSDVSSAPTLMGDIRVLCTSSPECADVKLAPATNVTLTTTTVLAGTTGSDGNITISAANGTLYIENRRGTSLSFAMRLLTRT